MEELKKQSFRKALVTAIVLLIIGAGIAAICTRFIIYEKFEDLAPEEIKNQNVTIDLTANFGSYLEEYSENTKTHKRTTTDLYYVIRIGDEDEDTYEKFEDLAPEEIKNQNVTIDLTANFGSYLEEYSENTETHKNTITDLYYVIWTGDEDATDFKYMSIKVPVEYKKQMEEIATNSANETFSEPLHMVGHIHKLGSEEYRYFQEYFLENDFTQSEFEEMTLPYYIDISGISTANVNDTEFKYMSVKVPVKYEKQMEEMANETFSEPFHMVGHIHKLSSEEYRYFKEYFLESDFSESEIDEYTLPYYIDISGTSAVNGSDLLFVIFICVGGFFILWGIVRLIKAVTGSYMKHFNNGIQEAGYSESAIESDMNHATGFHKNDIRLGNLCFYFGLNSTVPHAIPVSKLHWAYQTTTTHRTNGIKTGTTYAIVIRADVKGGNFTIAIPDNGTAQAILDQINVKYPWVVVGFSNELVKMYNKNRAEFLDMRYNKVDHYPKQPGMEGFNDGFNDSFNDNYNQFT